MILNEATAAKCNLSVLDSRGLSAPVSELVHGVIRTGWPELSIQASRISFVFSHLAVVSSSAETRYSIVISPLAESH